MPRTVMFRQTWGCPSCRSTLDRDPALEATQQDWATEHKAQPAAVGLCPYCWTGLSRATPGTAQQMRRLTNPAQMGTITVIGPEDVENEIGRMTFPTPTGENAAAYRARRLGDITRAIAAARQQEHT